MKRVEIIDLPEETRDLVRESEVRGEQLLLLRNGRPAAVVLSWDEYLAMSETIAIANDPMLYARIETADEELRNGRVILPSELLS